MSTVVVPSWVVPDVDAVRECERVSSRRLGLGPQAVTTRDVGVAAEFAWLTIGEHSPVTRRPVNDPDGVTWAIARAESWVALGFAAGARVVRGHPEGTIQLFTGPDTLKVRRLARDPRASIIVAAPVGERERWVSVTGSTTVEPDGGARPGRPALRPLLGRPRRPCPGRRARTTTAGSRGVVYRSGS